MAERKSQEPEQDSARAYGRDRQSGSFQWSPAIVASFTAAAIALITAFTGSIVSVMTAYRIENKVTQVSEVVDDTASKNTARDLVISDTHKLVNSRFTAALRSLVFLLKKEAERTKDPAAFEAHRQAVKDLEEAEAGAREVERSKSLSPPGS